MNAVWKLYENAGVKKIKDFNPKINWNRNNEDLSYYPPFTAEKQIEIVKVITTNHISDDYEYKYLGIDRDEIDREFYLNLCIDGSKYHARDKDFAVALAKLVNLLWQDLTEEEKEEIREILK